MAARMYHAGGRRALQRFPAGPPPAFSTKTHQQVPDDGDIDDQHRQPRERAVPRDLVQLQGHEDAGGDDGEIFGPPLLEQQPESFRREERRIGQHAGADRDEPARLEISRIEEQAMNEPPARVQVELIDPRTEGGGDVVVPKIDRRKPEDEQQGAFRELEPGDEPQKSGASASIA